MKIVGLVASVFSVFFAIGQKSYYFAEPMPSMDKKVSTIDKKYHGLYASKTAARKYEVSEEGIYIVSTSIASMSREEIRESSQYQVRNKHIFGVVAGDSIPCLLDGDRYYFGVRNHDALINEGSQHVLTKISASQYVINHFEDGFYTPELVRFESGKMIFDEFEYDLETTAFDFVAEQKNIPSDHLSLVILSPSQNEFDQLRTSGVFVEGVAYKKKRR